MKGYDDKSLRILIQDELNQLFSNQSLTSFAKDMWCLIRFCFKNMCIQKLFCDLEQGIVRYKQSCLDCSLNMLQ